MQDLNKQLQLRIGELIGKDYFKLEFGCKVKDKENGEIGLFTQNTLIDSYEFVFDRFKISQFLNKEGFKINFEIIGTEPSLQDLLMALRKTGVWYYISVFGELCVKEFPLDVKILELDLSISLFNQTDETKLALLELLK